MSPRPAAPTSPDRVIGAVEPISGRRLSEMGSQPKILHRAFFCSESRLLHLPLGSLPFCWRRSLLRVGPAGTRQGAWVSVCHGNVDEACVWLRWGRFGDGIILWTMACSVLAVGRLAVVLYDEYGRHRLVTA